MNNIVVTGSSGFIGRNLVKSLEESNYHIFKIDIESGFDLKNWELFESLDNFDYVIHLAAKTYVPNSFCNPRDFFINNLVSTTNILEFCRRKKTKMIFLSSYIYGKPEYLPIDEMHPVSPHNPYAYTKYICEQLCECYHKNFGVSVVIFRPFNIYGPGQNSNFLIPNIIEMAKTGRVVLNDPKPKRDFIYIEDIVKAIINVIELNSNIDYDVFNIGSGQSFSVAEVIKQIKNILPTKFEVFFTGKTRKNEILNTLADTQKLQEKTGWKHKIDLVEGLARMLRT